MTITTFNVLTGLAYLTLVVVASWVSWKKGEKEGSVFMLKYLREHKFFNDSDYFKFMKHIRTELLIDKINEVSPKELKKNEKED
jgi:hypothetical protein|tara:strand:+ start:239 stop:490 length:252 start_codon:yes stop_codon:yes gene_type:complete